MVTKKSTPTAVRRREFLAGTAMLLFSATHVGAATISGQLPWTPNAGSPPSRIKLGPWEFFTGEEGRTIETIADCVIPPDPETLGGREGGAARSSSIGSLPVPTADRTDSTFGLPS